MASRRVKQMGISIGELLHELLERGPGEYTSGFHKGQQPGCSAPDMLQECGDFCLR